jgi:hypothetical protein
MGNIMDLLAKRNEKEKTNFLYKLKFESKIIELTYDETHKQRFNHTSINCGLFMLYAKQFISRSGKNK